MIRTLALAALPALAISAAQAQSSPMSASDFVTKAAQSDQFEIQEGQLAQQKGGSASVKSFGERMVRDHTKTSATLMAAAKKAGLPAMSPPSLSPDQQSMISQLQGLSGAEFDKTYVQQQVQAHQQALDLMTTYAKGGDKPALKEAAHEAEPIIKQHLAMVEKMDKMGK